MTTGWPVWCLLFLLPLCCPASTRRGVLNFSSPLRLTRTIRARVQDLLPRYKEQQFGDRGYEDHSLVLKTLPSFHMDYSQWVRMKDLERLSTASKYLYTFWVHLDSRRQQMKKFWKDRTGRMKAMQIINEIFEIQRQLKALIGQVDSQLGILNNTTLPQTYSSPAPQVLANLTYPPPAQDLWSNRKQGYIVLRDLERYLGKLARDFIFLKGRQKGRPAAPNHTHTI